MSLGLTRFFFRATTASLFLLGLFYPLKPADASLAFFQRLRVADAPLGTSGYFVLSSTTYNGNRTNLATAHSTCYSDLVANSWLGKTDAQARSILMPSNVSAFLCDATVCTTLVPSQSYKFARSGSATDGGAALSTNANGLGPGNSTSWSGATYFNVTADVWTGRESGASTLWTDNPGPGGTCNSWSSSGGAVYGEKGATNQSGVNRWSQGGSYACSGARRLVCAVHPYDVLPNAFAFVAATGVSANVLGTSNTSNITGIGGPSPISVVGAGSPEYQICADASCTSVLQAWGSTPSTILDSQWVQIRLTSSPRSSTLRAGILRVGGTAGTYNVTTTSFDDIPNAFSFTDQTNRPVGGVVTSNIVQVTGFVASEVVVSGGDGLSREFRICSDAACSTVVQTWTSSPSAILNNQYLQLRQTAASYEGTATNFIVGIASTTDTWTITTSPPASARGYFVITQSVYNGNLGGLAGANALCLTELQNTNWAGKASATLNSTKVKAFLCDGSSCNTPPTGQTHRFATAGSVTTGGAEFTTGAVNLGPNDAASWIGVNYFTASGNAWTGRAAGTATNWPNTGSGTHCANWTAGDVMNNGTIGFLPGTDAQRWSFMGLSCVSSYPLLCYVNP